MSHRRAADDAATLGIACDRSWRHGQLRESIDLPPARYTSGGIRRPEELVQTIVEQRVLAVVLFGHLTGRRHPSQAGSALTVVLTGWHGVSRW